jgi:hypothetical protein
MSKAPLHEEIHPMLKFGPAALLVLPLLATAVALPLEAPPPSQGPLKPSVTAASDPGDKGPPEIPRKPF